MRTNSSTNGRVNSSLIDFLNTPVGNSNFRKHFGKFLRRVLEPEDFFKFYFGRNGTGIEVNVYAGGEYLLKSIPNEFQYKGSTFAVTKNVVERPSTSEDDNYRRRI